LSKNKSLASLYSPQNHCEIGKALNVVLYMLIG